VVEGQPTPVPDQTQNQTQGGAAPIPGEIPPTPPPASV
jgi:hypothetical protein